MVFFIVVTRKGISFVRNTHFEPSLVKVGRAVRPGRRTKDTKNDKKRVTSNVYGQNSSVPPDPLGRRIFTKFWVTVDVRNVFLRFECQKDRSKRWEL